MLIQMMGIMRAMNGRYAAAEALFGANEARMSLANNIVTDPSQIGDIFEKDKSLELQSTQARVMFAAYSAWEDAARQQLKKDLELERERIKVWYG